MNRMKFRIAVAPWDHIGRDVSTPSTHHVRTGGKNHEKFHLQLGINAAGLEPASQTVTIFLDLLPLDHTSTYAGNQVSCPCLIQ
jgi:hypothetical protein